MWRWDSCNLCCVVCGLGSLLALPLTCARAADADGTALLNALIAAPPDAYLEKLGELVKDPKSFNVFAKLTPENDAQRFMLEILNAWRGRSRQTEPALDVFPEIEGYLRENVPAGPGRPVSPVAGARLWGDDPFREARRHLPYLLEYLWKRPPVKPEDEWRRPFAFEFLGNYGQPEHARFCLDRIPACADAALADCAVDTALTLGREDALRELERRGVAGADAASYRAARERLGARRTEVRRKLEAAFLAGAARYPDPFYALAENRNVGVLATLGPLDSWELEWARRFVLGRWDFGLPHRTNRYGPFFYAAGLHESDLQAPLEPTQYSDAVRLYKGDAGKDLVPYLVQKLWLWATILGPSRKLLLLEVLEPHADAVAAYPLVCALAQEKHVAVADKLAELLARIGNAEMVPFVEAAAKKAPAAAPRLRRLIKRLQERAKAGG